MQTLPSFQHLKAVVFDWAGTVIDFGSFAPMGAFVQLFAQEGIQITVEEARVPMGLPKWQHIQALGLQPRIAQQWHKQFGQAISNSDIDRLHDIFTPMNAAAVSQHATLIPGVSDLVASLRSSGLKIGSTTGYTRPIMAQMMPLAAKQGFTPDNCVCADDLPVTRPSPFGIYRAMMDLNVWPAHHVVKVDDTVPGLLEGQHAGCWTVGVLASSNHNGQTTDQWFALSEQAKIARREHIKSQFKAATPDYWVDTVADLPSVLQEMESRLEQGYRPIR
ncbi:MAG: phosphonoacetaldehyde hydrolase [Burkholderiales bacterium]|nr:MAG: phosphonoacetaldehyde hydrolase [Burkholderiales bacterium]